LAWTASSDNVGVTGYNIYDGTTPVGTSTTGSFTVGGLTCGTAHTFAVEAFDAAGNSSTRTTVSGTTAACGGSVLTFSPVADAKVNEASPSTSYGTSTSLGSDSGSGVTIESYLRYTVSGIAGGQSVRSATLRIYVPSDGTADAPSAYSVADTTWSETGISWSNRPARATSATAPKGCSVRPCRVAAGTWIEYDVTPLITGNGTFSLDVGPTPTTDGTVYSSREATSNKPQLVLSVA
jgi:hypothetical protein